MTLCIAGVDPGSKGAVAFLYPEEAYLSVFNLPIYKVEGSSRTFTYCDGTGLADLIEKHKPTHAYLERVHAQAGDGLVGAWTFADNFGTIKGVLAGMRIPLTQVLPQAWKKALKAPADKQASKDRAKELFPACTALFSRSDRAEAAMIGLYGVLALGHAVTKRFTTKP